LLDLIWLGVSAFRLKVQDFLHPLQGENVVVTFDPFIEAKSAEKLAKPLKGDVRIPFRVWM